MPTKLTKTGIIHALHQFGLTAGDAVEVHSSLRSMGSVEGGAETVIAALMDVVGEAGAIVMSAYTVTMPIGPTAEEAAQGVVCKVQFFGEDEQRKSGMGIIPDTFRDRHDTLLGQGVHRGCAWGKDAELHCQGYRHLVDIDGWVLLIGVDIHRCSSMHLGDDACPEEFGKIMGTYDQLPAHLLAKYPEDQYWVEYANPSKEPHADPWQKVFNEADQRGLVRKGKIGEADCLLFKAKPMVDLYANWLREDPFGLYGLEKV